MFYKKNGKTNTRAVCLILLIMQLAIVNKSQTQEVRSLIREQIEQQKSVPQVDYSSQNSADEKRKKKSAKYDNGFQVIYPDFGADEQAVTSIDWEVGLPALPVEKSDLIILGRIVDAKAHLSNKKQSVYSEFKIEIEKVFKNSSQQEFEDGKYIRAERPGGIIRFPSGFKTWYWIAGQQMPIVDRRYVFFLTHNFLFTGREKEDFHLLTAYELREDRVFPLDNPNPAHPIVFTYRGKEVAILLNDLQKVLKSQ